MRNIVFYSLALIFLMSPFFQGLYFEKEIHYVSIIISLIYVLFVVHVIAKKKHHNVFQLSFLFVLPVLYLLSFFYAASPLGSLHLSIRWIMYVTFFVLLYWSTNNNERPIKLLPVILQVTGVWIALHTFFNVVGWIEFTDALLGGANRYSGVFQYPNTFGIVMIALFLFSLVMLSDRKLSTFDIVLYAAPLTMYFFMFIGSFSRGSFVVFPFAFFIALFLIRRSFRKHFVLISVATINPAFFLLLNFTPIIHLILLVILAFMTVSIVCYLKGKPLFQFKVEFFSSIGATIVLFIIDIFIHGSLKNMLPFTAQDKVESLSSGSSMWTRLLFNLDALKMSSDSPIIGHGGEGWMVLYRNYQQYPYQSNKIHNGFLEFLVDLGWFGFIIFLAALVMLLYFVLQNYLRGSKKALHAGVLVAILSLFAHSVVDFDFGFGTIWLIIFWLFTISLATEHHWGWKKVTEDGTTDHLIDGKDDGVSVPSTPSPMTIPALSLFTIIVMIGGYLSFQLVLGENSYTKATKAATYVEKERLLTEAIKKNQWNQDYLFELAEAKLNIDSSNTVDIRAIVDDIIQLEPNSVISYDMAGTLLEAVGEDELAYGNFMIGLQMDKYNTPLYGKTVQLLTKNQSEPLANQAIKVFDELKETYDILMENPPGKRYNRRDFGFTPDILLNIGTAYYVTGNSEAIEQLPLLIKEAKDEEEIAHHADVRSAILALYYVALEAEENEEALETFEQEYQAELSEIEPIIEEWQERLNISSKTE